MTTEADTINAAGAREIYELLNQLDSHLRGPDASGRALLYQAKERMRLLIISIDQPDRE
ncbi:MAG TPA: hypothetical protein VGL55_00890 [Steroidobacteraceae bacterium]|jgi:hypothetical protein